MLVAFVGAGRTFPRVRTAAYGGFWAGVLAAVVWLLAVTGSGLPGTGELSGAPFWVCFAVGVAIGLPVGFGLPALFVASRRRRRVGVVLLILSFGTSVFLINALLWPSSRALTTGVTLGTVIASCLAFITPRSAAAHYGQKTERWLDELTNQLLAAARRIVKSVGKRLRSSDTP
jgi:hypothetical protein